MRRAFVLFMTVGVVTVLALAQIHAQGRGGNAQGRGGRGGGQVAGDGGIGQVNVGGSPVVPDNQVTSQPIPKLPDGHIDITGPWVGGGSNNDMEADAGFKKGELDAMLLPWAQQVKKSRKKEDEPYTACLPMGVPRVNPYPWKFAMTYTSKGLSHIYVLHETGDAGAHRVIYMDGRKHPDPDRLLPTWWGHSIGSWDKDTLVVDTIGYNDKFWFDGLGTPHTEQLHTIERWTRINYGRITNDFTLDDPGAFSRVVQMKYTGRLLRPDLKTGGGDLMEFICLEDNEYGSAAKFRPGTGTDGKK